MKCTCGCWEPKATSVHRGATSTPLTLFDLICMRTSRKGLHKVDFVVDEAKNDIWEFWGTQECTKTRL